LIAIGTRCNSARVFGGFNEENIGTRVTVAEGTRDGALETFNGHRVGPRDHKCFA
jgi:hypothetical protein